MMVHMPNVFFELKNIYKFMTLEGLLARSQFFQYGVLVWGGLGFHISPPHATRASLATSVLLIVTAAAPAVARAGLGLVFNLGHAMASCSASIQSSTGGSFGGGAGTAAGGSGGQSRGGRLIGASACNEARYSALSSTTKTILCILWKRFHIIFSVMPNTHSTHAHTHTHARGMELF